MAYDKHTWERWETITAARLNNIEDGIANAGGGGGGGDVMICVTTQEYQPGEYDDPPYYTFTLDKTYAEIKEHITGGGAVFINMNPNETEGYDGQIMILTVVAISTNGGMRPHEVVTSGYNYNMESSQKYIFRTSNDSGYPMCITQTDINPPV